MNLNVATIGPCPKQKMWQIWVNLDPPGRENWLGYRFLENKQFQKIPSLEFARETSISTATRQEDRSFGYNPKKPERWPSG